MISQKRIISNVAYNFVSKGILNFPFNEIMENRLLIVLEKKLKKKQNILSNTFSSGFNVSNNN